ncbi:16S rRNA (cytidine(1402)-2'-O)-methyltransferase [Actinoplanes derwentensis]|uniref:Ribosomal RNA small subunit methyltransferase I n=1 Tax=Actinoplanes derwentensis TaxID=113562 RepID=A0A1H2D0E2_9ACTN|nr:16S rRNA (cytidine(1402)-2'-O)-methyltransferase [Actinoplanes derwentensis]GID85855.1 ribosomal RNA small subunit methyltransferase I [Actinoplanes derwentensis]SDT76248.1 16S rRNA (cytidine1402-2'-O)-methyltransferase [Actinoplanes derwentensis]
MSDTRETGGRVVLAGAPLGNTGDASARLREVLASADVVAAEDTRRLSRLAKDLGVTVSGRVVSYFEGNDERRTPELVEALRAGSVVVVVTDGGMPSVSDPGYRLVRAALDAGFPVTSAPGPSAVTTALALSGLPSDRFVFEGFLPRTGSNRRSRLRELAAEQRTLVFFEAPHRITGALEDLASIFGADRPAALCRELTKTYEEIRRDTLGALAAGAAEDPPRGEITLVVAGVPAGPPTPPDDGELRAAVAEREAAGQTRRDAIQTVADAYGLRKREVYALVHEKP